ncbi:BMC domain-containing protein [bacterium]
MQEALGVIETLGLATAIEAADASVKAANVELAEYLVAGGGKVNIIMRGDVAAVKASVEAGVASASKTGQVVGQTVIPRPSQKLTPSFNQIQPKKKKA